MTVTTSIKSIMIIIWKDPNRRLHGKRHKSDRYYFRVHYGKQRLVHLYKDYVDKPTEAQKAAREQFTELRREVARQLKDPVLRAKWEREFKADKQGYKMLHCYVYAQLKASPLQLPPRGEHEADKVLPKGLHVVMMSKDGEIIRCVMTRNGVVQITANHAIITPGFCRVGVREELVGDYFATFL